MSTVRTSDPKQLAKRLRTALAEHGTEIGHGRALELVARMLGHRDWNTLSALAPEPDGPAPGAIPLLRIFDTRKALEFYRDFLGFAVAWEHRFQDHAPLYAEVVRDGVRLHLTEHHGDASPGAAVIVEVADARALQRELAEKDYDYARPGIEREEWGLVVTVIDPFQNRLMFLQPLADEPDRVTDHGAPVVATVHVEAVPERAFEAFTAELDRWWDRDYAPPGTTGATLEPHVGGSLVFTGATTHVMGRVRSWEPPHRFSLDFWLAQDRDHPTVLELSFEPDGAGTLLTLTHGGWTAGNVAERAKFTDWPHLLERFAAYVRAG